MLLYRKRNAACTASKKIQQLFYNNKKELKPISSRDAIGKLFFNQLENYIQLEYGKVFYKYR